MTERSSRDHSKFQNQSCQAPYQHAWVEDLVGLWAVGDLSGQTRQLGWPAVSPMFSRLGEAAEVDSDGSYSQLEVIAMRQAIERLGLEHPAELDALLYRFKPWAIASRGLEPRPDLVALALARLAEWVDRAVDGC